MAHTRADPIKPCALVEVARRGECSAGELLSVKAIWHPLGVVAPLWECFRGGRMYSYKMIAKAHCTLVLVTADRRGGFGVHWYSYGSWSMGFFQVMMFFMIALSGV